MEITGFQDRYADGVIELWNGACKNDMPYAPFDKESFADTFIKNPSFSYDGTFVALDDGKVIGFANGIFRNKHELLQGQAFNTEPGYITFILVDRNYREKGIGGRLLSSMEEFLKSNGKRRAEITFFNPVNLRWYIPNTKGHDHPDSPGVDLGSRAFTFFINHDYLLVTAENAMHLDLANYKMRAATMTRINSLRDKGIDLEYYNKSKHSGFDNLFRNLNDEYWRKDIQDNLSLECPRPIIVASDRGKICGFTGPVAKEESGRGWFAGIGVDPAYQGRGIGTALFELLMDSFRQIGASFSTLHTGISNPAGRLYSQVGFKVVKQWAVMRKELV